VLGVDGDSIDSAAQTRAAEGSPEQAVALLPKRGETKFHLPLRLERVQSSSDLR